MQAHWHIMQTVQTIVLVPIKHLRATSPDVYKRQVVYVSDHSTVGKAEEIERSSFYSNISFRKWF